MQRALVAIWIAAPLVVAFSAVQLYRFAPKGDLKGLECPQCGKTVSLNPSIPVRNCPRCKDENIRMVPKYENRPSLFAWVMGPVLFEVNIFFGIYLVLFHLAQKRKNTVDEREFRRFNCPGCGQKLRYHLRRAGAAGQCPRCNNLFTFPEEEEETNEALSGRTSGDEDGQQE